MGDNSDVSGKIMDIDFADILVIKMDIVYTK